MFFQYFKKNILTNKLGFTLAEGAEHVGLSPIKARFGFTLAEVLVTLGVIGVIAAMTIPGLMSNYRKRQLQTQIKADVSIIQQAVRFAEYEDTSYDMAIQDGSTASTKEWFDSFLGKHLKVEQLCIDKPGCWQKGES